MACVALRSSFSASIAVRPSAPPSRLEIAETICLTPSRSPPDSAKLVRPLESETPTIACTTHRPAVIVSRSIVGAATTDASAAARAALAFGSVDARPPSSQSSSSISLRSCSAASVSATSWSLSV